MEPAMSFRNEKISGDPDCVKRTDGMVGTVTDECAPPITPS